MKKLLSVITCVSLSISIISAMDIKAGWQLKGANQDINTSTFENPNINSIWQYDTNTKSWKVYFPNNPEQMNNLPSSISKLDSIAKNTGFWVYSNKDVTLDEKSSMNFNNDLINGKTYYIVHKYNGDPDLEKYGYVDDMTFSFNNYQFTYNVNDTYITSRNGTENYQIINGILTTSSINWKLLAQKGDILVTYSVSIQDDDKTDDVQYFVPTKEEADALVEYLNSKNRCITNMTDIDTFINLYNVKKAADTNNNGLYVLDNSNIYGQLNIDIGNDGSDYIYYGTFGYYPDRIEGYGTFGEHIIQYNSDIDTNDQYYAGNCNVDEVNMTSGYYTMNCSEDKDYFFFDKNDAYRFLASKYNSNLDFKSLSILSYLHAYGFNKNLLETTVLYTSNDGSIYKFIHNDKNETIYNTNTNQIFIQNDIPYIAPYKIVDNNGNDSENGILAVDESVVNNPNGWNYYKILDVNFQTGEIDLAEDDGDLNDVVNSDTVTQKFFLTKEAAQQNQ